MGGSRKRNSNRDGRERTRADAPGTDALPPEGAEGRAEEACPECANTDPSTSPGPDPDHSKRRKDTEKTKPAWYKIGCPFGHRSALTKTTGGGGTGVLSRRSYRCGVCNGRFSQLLPSNCAWHARRALWLHETKVRRMALPGERGTRIGEKAEAHIGDVVHRFHNSGGMTEPTKRKKYLTRMMKGEHILGLCEVGLDEKEKGEMRRFARWDSGVNADVWARGRHIGATRGWRY